MSDLEAIEAAVAKLGGLDGVRRFLSNEMIVVKSDDLRSRPVDLTEASRKAFVDDIARQNYWARELAREESIF